MGTIGISNREYAWAIWVKIAKSQEGVIQCSSCCEE